MHILPSINVFSALNLRPLFCVVIKFRQLYCPENIVIDTEINYGMSKMHWRRRTLCVKTLIIN